MAGVPHHAAAGYIARLLAQGQKVAICEQMADPSKCKGIVPRQVVRVITPGTVTEIDQLDARANLYLAAVDAGEPASTAAFGEAAKRDAALGLALLDLSTGELCASSVADAGALLAEIARAEPREILFAPGLGRGAGRRLAGDAPRGAARGRSARRGRRRGHAGRGRGGAALRRRPQGAPAPRPARGRAGAALRPPRHAGPAPAGAAAGAPRRGRGPLHRRDRAGPPRAGARGRTGGARGRSSTSSTPRSRPRARASCAGGCSRRSWTSTPSARASTRWRSSSPTPAPARSCARRSGASATWSASRCAPPCARPPRASSAHLRDGLLAAPRAVAAVRSIADTVLAAGDPRRRRGPRRPTSPRASPPRSSTGAAAARARGRPHARRLRPEARRAARHPEGRRRAGHRAGGRAARADGRERRCAVKFNNVFGYYIEVTKSHLAKVPKEWRRKQTVAGGERYTNDALDDLADKIEHAEERARWRSRAEVFQELLAAAAAASERVKKLARVLAGWDVAAALADLAHRNDYARPVGRRRRRHRHRRRGATRWSSASPRRAASCPTTRRSTSRASGCWLITGPEHGGQVDLHAAGGAAS